MASSLIGTPRHDQQGAVLIVTLIMLLLVTLVVFSALRAGAVDARVATADMLRAMTFQAAESSIEQVARSVNNLPAPSDAAAPIGFIHTIPAGASGIVNSVQASAAFKTSAPAPGYSIRRGGAGLQTHYYEVTALAQTTQDTPVRTQVVAGVFVEAPRSN